MYHVYKIKKEAIFYPPNLLGCYREHFLPLRPVIHKKIKITLFNYTYAAPNKIRYNIKKTGEHCYLSLECLHFSGIIKKKIFRFKKANDVLRNSISIKKYGNDIILKIDSVDETFLLVKHNYKLEYE
jgi:hypothetical protein